MDQTLGKRIVSNRKRLGMTQDKLAEHLGVTAQAVSKWENDQACPDISTLPRLAALFGITTDELLGITSAPAREAEVVEEDDRSDSAPTFEMHWDSGRKTGLGFALWVLITGGILLASSILAWDIGLWDTLWTSGLALFGFFGLFPRFSFFRLGCALFGTYFLLDKLDAAPFRLGKELILPTLLVLFGLSLLVDAMKKPKKPSFTVSHKGKRIYTNGDSKGKLKSHCHMDGKHFDCGCSFGEDHRLITLPYLSSGEASVSFGELTVDLSGCTEIADHCHIEASCSFGELNLLIPSHCRVEHDARTAFAAVEFEGHPAPDADTTIILDCSANFGEISVRYI